MTFAFLFPRSLGVIELTVALNYVFDQPTVRPTLVDSWDRRTNFFKPRVSHSRPHPGQRPLVQDRIIWDVGHQVRVWYRLCGTDSLCAAHRLRQSVLCSARKYDLEAQL